VPIELDSFHHIYNRGTDKRLVFMDDSDRRIFLRYMYVLNDADIESPSRALVEEKETPVINKRLVNVCAFCLMPNHFHLLLYECTPSGISKYLQRLGTAYTMYFNEKYERSGALFQGVFKSKLIKEYNYLISTIDYLHLNPVQHRNEDGDKITRSNAAAILEKYQWSSYKDFCGEPTYPRILQSGVLKDFIEVPGDYRSWLREQHDFSAIQSLMIDFQIP